MTLLRKIGLRFDKTCVLPGHPGPVNLFVPAQPDAATPDAAAMREPR